jgi:hypothetical protein
VQAIYLIVFFLAAGHSKHPVRRKPKSCKALTARCEVRAQAINLIAYLLAAAEKTLQAFTACSEARAQCS